MQSVYKDPPPYPGPVKLAQPGFRQSYSGSETSTDPSGSSLESLSTTYRQDPPGEENSVAGSSASPASVTESGRPLYAYGSGSEFKVTGLYGGGGAMYYAPSMMTGDVMAAHWQQQQQVAAAMASGQQQTPLPQFQRDNVTGSAAWRPPPDYPGSSSAARRSYEGLDRPQASAATRLTGSQPELALRSTKEQLASVGGSSSATANGSTGSRLMKQPLQQQDDQRDFASVATRASRMVEVLSEENKALRSELEGYYGKVSRLQKFEIELQKVQEAHECLVRSSQKRESLENTMRLRMEAETEKLKEENRSLRDQVASLSQQLVANPTLVQMKEIIDRKNDAVRRLAEQNKELTTTQETADVQLRTARLAAEELQRRVETIEEALSSTKEALSKTEDELRRRAAQASKVEQVQAAFASLQQASEKKELLERQYRDNLERELRTLRSTATAAGRSSTDADAAAGSEGTTTGRSDSAAEELQRLRRELASREDKVMQLQREVVRWEEKYAQEVARRELATSLEQQRNAAEAAAAGSECCEARLAALEQSALHSERTIAEAQRDRLKHMEEAYHASRRVAELEARLKSALASVSEKDAVLRVLQRRQGSNVSAHSGSGSMSSPRVTPTHSPNPSRTSTDEDHPARRQASEDEAAARTATATSLQPQAAAAQTWHV